MATMKCSRAKTSRNDANKSLKLSGRHALNAALALTLSYGSNLTTLSEGLDAVTAHKILDYFAQTLGEMAAASASTSKEPPKRKRDAHWRKEIEAQG